MYQKKKRERDRERERERNSRKDKKRNLLAGDFSNVQDPFSKDLLGGKENGQVKKRQKDKSNWIKQKNGF